jgi:hypothetical protein
MYDKLINLGRGMIAFGGSKRGALMDMHGNKVFYRNTKGSVLYEVTSPTKLGEGVFYAGEAVANTKSIETRGEQVVFEYQTGKTNTKMYLAIQEPYHELAEKVLEKFYKETNIFLPLTVLDELNTDMLAVTMKIKGDTLTFDQARSDGAVKLEKTMKLLDDYGDERSVTFFTKDLILLKGFVNQLKIGVTTDQPISLWAQTNFGAVLRGLISHQTFER